MMEQSPHVMQAGTGAESFAREHDIALARDRGQPGLGVHLFRQSVTDALWERHDNAPQWAHRTGSHSARAISVTSSTGGVIARPIFM